MITQCRAAAEVGVRVRCLGGKDLSETIEIKINK